jgi:hypothetical protein
LAGKSVRDQEASLHIPGKAPRLLVVTGKHLSDAKGHTVGAVIAVHDITARQRAIESQHEATVRLEAGLERLRRVNDWAVVLGELTSALQSCSGIDEAHALVTKFMRRLFPERAGALFVPEPEGDRFSCFAQWGTRRLTRRSSTHVIAESHLHGALSAGWFTPSFVGTFGMSKGLTPSRSNRLS